MTDPLLKDLLSYHHSLNDAEYNRQVMARIHAANRQRRLIVTLFTLLGVLISAVYFWSVLSATIWPHLLTPVNGMLFFCLGLLIFWLWTDDWAFD